jgi:hypothetical protein
MKRASVLLAPAFLALAIGGCGGGIEEGMAKGDLPPSGTTSDFQAQMKRDAGKMGMKKPAKTAAPEAAK